MNIHTGDMVEYQGNYHRVIVEVDENTIALDSGQVLGKSEVRFAARDYVSRRVTDFVKMPAEQRLELVRRAIRSNASAGWRDGFESAVVANFAIFDAFVSKVVDLINAGRNHYSARTIMEVIRHESILRQGGEFKINNNLAPDFARLCMNLFPELRERGFFELRNNVDRVVAARGAA